MVSNCEKLYVFNPDTDMALGSNCRNYTPPINIQSFIRKLALLPALYAQNDSLILLPPGLNRLDSCNLIYYDIVKSKNIKLITDEDLTKKYFHVIPWGWDETLCNRLSRKGVIVADTQNNILNFNEICSIRKALSHRRISIKIHKLLLQHLGDTGINIPIEFTDSNMAYDWASNNLGCYLKSPWSSSGKGIFHCCESNKHLVEAWINATIKKQGSILAEVGELRALDFATEWTVKDAKAQYEGLSVFKVNEHGNYQGNYLASEKELTDIVASYTDCFTPQLIDALRQTIDELISPFYNGPLGVDMLVTKDGRLNPCVEVNLRNTMGHVALSLCKQGVKDEYFEPGKFVNFK